MSEFRLTADKNNELENSNTATTGAARALSSDRRRRLLYGAGALALALAVRLYLFAGEYTINGDGIRYVAAARSFWHGQWAEGLSSFYPPFFPLLIAAAYPIAGNWELAGRLWPLLLGSLMLLPIYLVLKPIYGPKIAVIGMLVYSISPFFVRFSADVRSEVPYTFFFLLAVYFFLKGVENGGRAAFFFMGLNAALAYLIRPEGIGLIIVAVGFLAWRRWTQRAAGQVWLKAIILCAGFSLLASPYVLYLHWDTGGWTISRKTANVLAIGITHYDKSVDGVRRERSDKVDALRLAASRPLLYAKKILIDGFRTLDVYVVALHYSAVPFLLIGWYMFFRSRFWDAKDFFLLVLIVFYFAVFSVFYPNRRFTMPLVPLSLGWVGLGFTTLQQYSQAKLSRHKAVLVSAVIIVLFCAATLPKSLKALSDTSSSRAAAAYLNGKPDNSLILSTNPQVAFYAERKRVLVARSDIYVGQLAVVNPDYLVVDEHLFDSEGQGLQQRGWAIDRHFPGRRDGIYILVRR